MCIMLFYMVALAEQEGVGGGWVGGWVMDHINHTHTQKHVIDPANATSARSMNKHVSRKNDHAGS